MAEQRVYNLKIDDGFRQLIPPLSPEELQQLEQNILRDGCRDPLSVWNSTILDGHNRYEICTRHEIPFAIQRINLKNREEAIVWICANQLGRRNISEETRKYLIGKRYEMEKILGAHNVAGTNQHTKNEVRAKMLPEPPYGITAGRTRERLAEEYNISHATVLKYEKYAQALDSLAKVSPELVPKILSGEVKVSHENALEMSRLSGQDVKRLSQLITDESAELVGNIRSVLPQKTNPIDKSLPSIPPGSIKNMPAYDPDAEISSLALTVPSWVSSINRTRSTADFSYITVNARCMLEKQLLELKETIDSMLAAMKEGV
jgi:hypothetical protein